MPRRPLFTFLPNYLQFFASKCSILGIKMFNSRARISIFPFIHKYLASKVFCGVFVRFLFPLPSHAVGRNEEAAVLIWMQDAAAVNREAGLGGGVGGSGGVVGLGGLDAYEWEGAHNGPVAANEEGIGAAGL